MFADVESANVVGYHQVGNKTGVLQQMQGSSFVNISKDTVYHLYDFTIGGGLNTRNKRQRNFISFIKPNTAAFDSTKQFWYDSGATPPVWKYKNTATNITASATVISEKDAEAPDFEIPKGSGFLFSVNASDNAILQFSGQVQTGVAGKIDVSVPSGVAQYMVVNPACREISLAEITISGPDTRGKRQRNFISFIKTNTAAFDSARQYWYDSSETPGVWKYKNATSTTSKDGEVPEPEKIKIAMGEGFLFSVNASDGAVLHFPDALTPVAE